MDELRTHALSAAPPELCAFLLQTPLCENDLCVHVCVCACVCERERGKERGRESVCVLEPLQNCSETHRPLFGPVCVCICVCV